MAKMKKSQSFMRLPKTQKATPKPPKGAFMKHVNAHVKRITNPPRGR